MKDRTMLLICALICVTVVEACAILTGEDGALLAPFFIFCGALVGIPVGALYQEKK